MDLTIFKNALLRGVNNVEPPKNLALEGLRGLACLNVVLAHYMFTFMPYAGHFLFPTGSVSQRFGIEHWLAKPFFSVFYNGSYPVSIFFVMSGWVLTAPFFRGGGEPSRAALKRYPRLMIPAAGAILFSWLLFNLGLMGNQRAAEVGFAGWVRDQYVHAMVFAPDLLLNMLWGAPVNGQTEWDSPLWTLRIELLAPLLLFALLALFGKRKPLLITLVFTAIAVNIFPQNSLAIHLLAFLSGYLLNFALPYLQRARQIGLALLVLGIVFGAFDYSRYFSLLVRVPLPDLTPYAWNLGSDRKALFHTIGGLFTVAGVLAEAPGFGWLAARQLAWLGKVSFSAYLLHWPLICSLGIATVASAKRAGLSYPVAVLLGGITLVSAVYILAALFERWVDRPAIGLANRLTRPRSAIRAPVGLAPRVDPLTPSALTQKIKS
jgi:peptidoglycan/LPS O-acetylase OafA/YrhL